MKKITLMFVILLSYTGFAQFAEGFEGGLALPVGWTVINGGDVNTWKVFNLTDSGLNAHSGNKVAGILYEPQEGSGEQVPHSDYLITPAITVTAGINEIFSFWARSADQDFPESIALKLSTTAVATTDFNITLDAAIAPLSGPENYFKYTYDLSQYAGQTVYIAFYSSTVNNFFFDIDDVVSGSSLGTPVSELEGFNYYPNPVQDILNLASKENMADVIVYNLLGQQVFYKKVNALSAKLDLSGLSKGTYIVKVNSANKTQTLKVIKQ